MEGLSTLEERALKRQVNLQTATAAAAASASATSRGSPTASSRDRTRSPLELRQRATVPRVIGDHESLITTSPRGTPTPRDPRIRRPKPTTDNPEHQWLQFISDEDYFHPRIYTPYWIARHFVRAIDDRDLPYPLSGPWCCGDSQLETIYWIADDLQTMTIVTTGQPDIVHNIQWVQEEDKTTMVHSTRWTVPNNNRMERHS